MEGEAAHGKREESDGFAVPPSLSGSVFSIFWGVPKYGRHRSVEIPPLCLVLLLEPLIKHFYVFSYLVVILLENTCNSKIIGL